MVLTPGPINRCPAWAARLDGPCQHRVACLRLQWDLPDDSQDPVLPAPAPAALNDPEAKYPLLPGGGPDSFACLSGGDRSRRLAQHPRPRPRGRMKRVALCWGSMNPFPRCDSMILASRSEMSGNTREPACGSVPGLWGLGPRPWSRPALWWLSVDLQPAEALGQAVWPLPA